MKEFIKNFSIDDIVKNSDNRRFTAYGSVEIYDRHKQLIPINEIIKAMDNYMSNSGILLDQHSNKPVGKVLNWYPVTKEGANAVKITGEIYKSGRNADRVWNEIKEGKREGISVGGSSKTVQKTEDGEMLTGIEIDEFSIVSRCGNQGATFDAISMAKSEDSNQEITKQTNDMEQTSQNSTDSEDEIKDLQEKVNVLMNEISELKSFIESGKVGEKEKTINEELKMSQEEIKKEEVQDVNSQEIAKEDETTQQEVQEEVKVEKQEEQNVDVVEITKALQESINNLTKEVRDLAKSQEEYKVVKTEKPVQKEMDNSNKVQDIMKELEKGTLDKKEAIRKLMESQ